MSDDEALNALAVISELAVRPEFGSSIVPFTSSLEVIRSRCDRDPQGS